MKIGDSGGDASPAPRGARAELDELFDVLDDLLKRIADSDDANIRRKRAHVRAQLEALRSDGREPTEPARAWLPPMGRLSIAGQSHPAGGFAAADSMQPAAAPRDAMVAQVTALAALTGVALVLSVFEP